MSLKKRWYVIDNESMMAWEYDSLQEAREMAAAKVKHYPSSTFIIAPAYEVVSSEIVPKFTFVED